MEATVSSLKPSKSGNSLVASFHVIESKVTPFGTQTIHRYYNMSFAPDTCTLAEGEVIDLDLSLFDIRTTAFNGNTSFWLEFKG
jgi:hypothetical protein